MAERLDARLEGPILVQTKVFGDERGVFAETYRREEWAELGIRTRSSRTTSRGRRLPPPPGDRGARLAVQVQLGRAQPRAPARPTPTRACWPRARDGGLWPRLRRLRGGARPHARAGDRAPARIARVALGAAIRGGRAAAGRAQAAARARRRARAPARVVRRVDAQVDTLAPW